MRGGGESTQLRPDGACEGLPAGSKSETGRKQELVTNLRYQVGRGGTLSILRALFTCNDPGIQQKTQKPPG